MRSIPGLVLLRKWAGLEDSIPAAPGTWHWSALLAVIQQQMQTAPVAEEDIAEQVALELQQLEVGNVSLNYGRGVAAAKQGKVSRQHTCEDQHQSWSRCSMATLKLNAMVKMPCASRCFQSSTLCPPPAQCM